MRFIAVIVLVSLSACGKEPLDIQPPDIEIDVDWQQHVFKDPCPVNDSDYLPCAAFPMLLNPGHKDNYELRFVTENFVSKLQFQKGDASSFMVYVRHVPDAIDEWGTWYMRGEVVLLDMRNGKTTELGETTGRPSIGGRHVIFPNRSEIMVYDIRSGEHQTIDGAIDDIKISPDGEHVFFSVLEDFGGFQDNASYIYQIDPWEKVYESTREEVYRVTWTSNTMLLFRAFDRRQELQELNLSTKEIIPKFGPYENGFARFSDVSADLLYAYGYQPYVKNLESGAHLDINETYDGPFMECETRDYGHIHVLPSGELLIERIYHTRDDEKQVIKSHHFLHLFDADGTNERMVTLLLE